MSTKELQAQIVDSMHRWQKLENATVSQTAQIMGKADNPILRLVMEIIQRDSQMHHRVQQLVIDSFEKQAVTLNPDELAGIWDMIESHIEMERKTIELAQTCLQAMKGRKMVVQEYLLHYLMVDEKKHDEMLESLEKIKKGMYPYG